MQKANCWDFKGCGREPGGIKSAELGVCAASVDTHANGLNSGKNGGRICWAVTGTLCGGKVQGSFAEKRLSCMTCEVFAQIKEEEGLANFKLMVPGQMYIPQPEGEKLQELQEAANDQETVTDLEQLPDDERLARLLARAYWRGVTDAYTAVNGPSKKDQRKWLIDQTEKWWPKYLKKAKEYLERIDV